MTGSTEREAGALEAALGKIGEVAVAVSGGVDSMTLAVIAGLIYGAMWALVIFVEPQPREVTIRIPAERVNPPATGTIRP